MRAHCLRLVSSLVLLASAVGVSAQEKILRWTEVRDINGQKVTLTGKQVFDPGSGSQQTLYFDAAGNPMPDSFVKANQKKWAEGGGVSVQPESTPYRAPEPRVMPTSIRFHLTRNSATVTLSAPDLGPILQEDQRNQTDAKGALRVGFFRDLPRTVTPDNWIALPDGSHVWTLRLVSPGAEAIRVHLENVRLPPGAQVVQYATDNPAESYGPYGADYLRGESNFWTESTFSQDVTVECTAPPGMKTSDVSFEISRIVHVYVKFDAWVRPKSNAGFCENDVTCYPDWAVPAAGVCGLGNIGEAGFLFCTGCLIADSDPGTTIDYFMTANHCVSNQTEASTLEFYWFYQTSTCNGTPPNILNVPRSSGGADFLAGASRDSGSDFAFLQLRSSPPGGVTYEGWSTTTPTTTETLTGIHHPNGSWKRISFSNFKGYDGDFTDVQWFSGVTEPGSSGSPLFNAAQQFIGQLYGGHSYCLNPNGIDEYGSFDITYPIISQYLNHEGTPPAPTLFYEDMRDFDGDGKSDLSVYSPSSATWYFLKSAAGFSLQQFGYDPTIQFVGDFDGDGKSDYGVYNQDSGNWYIMGSSAGFSIVQFGFHGTLPVPADYDGDGKTDIAVFDPATGNWYLRQTTAGFAIVQFGFNGVTPVPCDYDGDGKSDIAVYDPPTGNWYMFRSTAGFLAQNWGYSRAIPAPADYDGDGKRDIAVFDPVPAQWYLLQTTRGPSNTVFGAPGGFVVPGDFDNDGKADLATYELSTGTWLIRESTLGVKTNQFGWSGAPPVGLSP